MEENKKGCCCGEEQMHHHNEEGCGCGEGHKHHNHEGEGCGCGCDDHDHEALIVDLEDENGNVIQCEIVDGFLFEENEYALVQNPEDGSIYLFKVVGDDETGELVVPEDGEYEAARAYYEQLIESEAKGN